MLKPYYDVLIIGGGPAGLSAALSIGRMRRSALVCDDGSPRNQPSRHAHNLPSQDGIHPAEWRKNAKSDLRRYDTIEFFDGSVKSARKKGNAFSAELASGERVEFRKLILAHGITDRLPEASGFKELWGKSIFHCPYCHGYEARGQRLGLVGNGAFAEHLLPMLFALSKDLVLFSNGPSELGPDFKTRVLKREIKVIETKISALEREGDRLKSVVLEDGTRLARDGLFVVPRFPVELKSRIGTHLGCERNEMGFFVAQETVKTTVPGVFAAGDILPGHQSVLGAAALGQMAGARVASELTHEDF